MAHIRKRGDSWIADVCVDRVRKSKSFKTKRDAVLWSSEQEEDGILAQHTLRQAIEKYEPISRSHRGSQSELSRLESLKKVDFIDTPLELITPLMVSKYREKRLVKVSPVSVRRELIILSSIFKIASTEWGWMRKAPDIAKPPPPKSRNRGITKIEIESIVEQLELMTTGKQVAVLFLLAIETGMRLGELLSIRWEDVSEKYVTLRQTKNGDSRPVPLSQKARQLIDSRKDMHKEKVFTLTQHVASTTFRRARDKTPYKDVHFHDSRSEAITRLSKKLDVLQLAKVIGHRDIKSLMFYYAESPESIAEKLG